MELYSGGTYGERQKLEGQLPIALVLDVGVKIAGALQTAHDRGLLHRDIKPNNLFVSEFGEPALGDFGISTLDDERSISGGGGLTVHYAPPEVLEGSPATPLSDVCSLAATLYTLLEGTRPFAPAPGARQSVGGLARRIMLEDPPRARRSDVSRSLADVLAGAMAKRPADRPPSAAALGQELQRVQGELGLSVTPLPLATAPPDRSGPSPGEVSGDSAADSPLSPMPPPPPAAASVPSLDAGDEPLSPASISIRPVEAVDDGEHGNTVTVGRPVPSDEMTDTAAGAAGHSTRRIVIGTVTGVACLLAVAISLLVFSRSSDDDASSTTVRPPATQILEVRPPAPTGVAVTPGTVERQVVVSWAAVGDGPQEIQYQVQPETNGLVAQKTAALTVTYDLPEQVTAAPCFHVVAITTDGRISAQSELACG